MPFDFIRKIDQATGLHVRTLHALERSWFPLRVPDDLPYTSDDDLLGIRNIGRKALDEIRELYPHLARDDASTIRGRWERCG